MRLLIITQKIDLNDDILGFFHKWVEKLAEKSEKVYVITSYLGEYNLPKNAEIFSLGKEKGLGKMRRYFLFYKFFLSNIKNSDGVFFHMCPEYVLAAGLAAKILGKKTLLWYAHKSINWRLRLAEKIVDKIFTASKESFRLKSQKVEITGHGIDIEKFPIYNFQFPNKLQNNKYKIITAGRIAKVKNLDLLIEVAEILKSKNFNFFVKIAGTAILDKDKDYLENLKQNIFEKKMESYIDFCGKIPYKEIEKFYQEANLFVNFSGTGSLDKAILEAMACGLNILTLNEAFKDILPEENLSSEKPQEIAKKIIFLSNKEVDSSLREYVFKNHDLNNLTSKIIKFYG
ncbi:MAG: glycosyltransferase family 4 protein [Patescibacteria group bacterium]